MDFSINTDIFETTIQSDKEFIYFAKKIGLPTSSRAQGEIIETLIARESVDVEKDSLSKRYGIETFPIHTDCAYLKVPPKFVLLRYIGSVIDPTPTVVVHFDKSKLSIFEKDFIENVVWFVRSRSMGFYSTILNNGILRYDREVMSLANKQDDIMPSILSKMDQTEISWSLNKVLVINNHRLLHYRPGLLLHEKNNRILQRINIL